MWQVSRPAFLLFVLAILTGLLGGALVGSWVLPVAIALAHGGWHEVLNITTREWIFADPPGFLVEGSSAFAFVDWARLIFGCLGLGVGMTLGLKLWRHLAVQKYRWLTSEQADDFLKRDPGW